MRNILKHENRVNLNDPILYQSEATIFPKKSVKLKRAIRRTGVHEPNSHDMISDSIPGNNDRVTKYAIVIDNIWGQISFVNSIRDTRPAFKIVIQL